MKKKTNTAAELMMSRNLLDLACWSVEAFMSADSSLLFYSKARSAKVRFDFAQPESADFVTEEQKRDIFCRNAARFLRLEPSICEQQPAEKH
jgi:hypothetical protein